MAETKPVRKGEELNAENLAEYLRAELNFRGVIEISQFPSGSSNLTYCIKIGDEEYVLRRPPFGNAVKSAHDMKREFGVLEKLSKAYKPAPKPLIYCADETVIGSDFYLMERREGIILRGDLHAATSNTGDDGETRSSKFQQKLIHSFIQNLVDLHSIDYKSIGLSDLGNPEGYTRRQAEGWTKRYFNAKTDENPELEEAINWLNKNIPNSGASVLIHNDYKFDNLMLNPENPTEIAAVLDWEMTTIGDPLTDLGSTLGYWMAKDAGEELLSMPANPRDLMENFTRKNLVEIYADLSGADTKEMLFYYVFGTVKLAGIAQQIYARYAKGYTKDVRFTAFNRFVNKLGKIAAKSIENDSI